jgi:hypothetical protein
MVFYYNDRFFREGSIAIQQAFLQLGANIVYVADVPEFSTPPSRCRRRTLNVLPEAFSRPPADRGHFCSEELESILKKPQESAYPEFMDSVKTPDGRVQIFDGLQVFCDQQRCAEGDDRGVFFFNATAGGHVNVRGSEKMLVCKA